MIGDGDAEKTQLLGPLDEADQVLGLYCRVRDSEVKPILHQSPSTLLTVIDSRSAMTNHCHFFLLSQDQSYKSALLRPAS
jgi:hypothetical protein